MFSFLNPYIAGIKIALIVVAFGTTIIFTHRYDVGQQAEGLVKAYKQGVIDIQAQDAVTLKNEVDAAKQRQKADDDLANSQTQANTHVSQTASNKCVVPVGLIRLLNASATGTDAIPLRPGLTDDSPAGVGLTALSKLLNDNAINFKLLNGEVKDWQAWYNQQASIKR